MTVLGLRRPIHRGKLTVLIVVGLATTAMFVLMRPDLIFTANTPTGGDMGAHVWLPAFVRDNLLPQGRIMGWSNDWYAGFPALYFYFPLPILAIVLFDVVLPYGVAFKLVTASGIVLLPLAAYYFIRSMGFARAVAAVGAVAGSTYVLMESHNIFGGNIKATMAGEFAFSIALALGLFYLGAVIRATGEGRGFSPLAGLFLALTALSHIIVVIVVVVASLPLLVRRRGSSIVLGSWIFGFALAAFWAIPLLVRFSAFTADMGWNPVEGLHNVFPREFLPIVVLGALGMLWSMRLGRDIVPAVWLAVLPVAGFLILPVLGLTKLYNARLLPFWYLTMYLFAGIAVGLGIAYLARTLSRRRLALAAGTVGAAVFFLTAGLVAMAQIPGWVRWNYTGYEGKEPFPEYNALMQEVGSLPDGRVMWEANRDMGRYGTPMSLMLFPYWTEGSHDSMEGLYFESSISTPFHFLNAAEVSRNPSNPVSGLDYHNFNFDRGLQHLPVFNVRYYVSFTEEATDEANSRELPVVAEASPWTIFELPDSSLVDVATTVPAVYEGGDFYEAALDWYGRVDELDLWLVSDGPDTWPRTTVADSTLAGVGRPIETSGTVSNIVLENERIAFSTTAVGVPHLVKVSHFPNWQATGAEGPYRAAPSLMVVIPTQEDVEITFERTWDEYAGMGLTLAGLLLLAAWPLRHRLSDLRSKRGRFGN